ncbi:MAG: 50S ribosomal protein L29 [Methylococcaceae bacterium]|nr:50S ribosomal protein L29 [Methylococcaceae bacterium]
MKAKDLRKKTKDEMVVLLADLLKEKFNLKMQKGTGQLAKPSQVKSVRRDIARIHTLIKETAGS